MSEDPMDDHGEFVDFVRHPNQACEEDGHLMHDDGSGTIYCARCPYVEEQPAATTSTA